MRVNNEIFPNIEIKQWHFYEYLFLYYCYYSKVIFLPTRKVASYDIFKHLKIIAAAK